jgi:hypothetical protein
MNVCQLSIQGPLQQKNKRYEMNECMAAITSGPLQKTKYDMFSAQPAEWFVEGGATDLLFEEQLWFSVGHQTGQPNHTCETAGLLAPLCHCHKQEKLDFEYPLAMEILKQ